MGRVRAVRVAMKPVGGTGTWYCSREYGDRNMDEFDGNGPYVHARNVGGNPHSMDGYDAHEDDGVWVFVIPDGIPDVDAESEEGGVG